MEAHDACTQRAVTIRRNQAILSLEYVPREARSKQGTTRGGRSIRFFSDARLEGRGEKWGTVDGGEGGGGKRSTPVTPRSYDASLIPEMLAHTL